MLAWILSPLLRTAAVAAELAEVTDCESSHDGSWEQFKFPPQCRGSGESQGRTAMKVGEETQQSICCCPQPASSELNVHAIASPVGSLTHYYT